MPAKKKTQSQPNAFVRRKSKRRKAKEESKQSREENVLEIEHKKRKTMNYPKRIRMSTWNKM